MKASLQGCVDWFVGRELWCGCTISSISAIDGVELKEWKKNINLKLIIVQIS